MRLTLAMFALTMLGCTLHSHTTYVEYGSAQHGAQRRRPHSKTAQRASAEERIKHRKVAAKTEGTEAVGTRNPSPTPGRTEAARHRHRSPASFGYARTGVPDVASQSGAPNARSKSDEPRASATFDESKNATRDPDRSKRATHPRPLERAPRRSDSDDHAEHVAHSPVAGAFGPKETIVRQTDRGAPASDRLKRKAVGRVATAHGESDHDSGTWRGNPEVPPSTRAAAAVAAPKARDHQQTVSTDAAYKRVLRTRDERLLDDPKKAQLMEPDERVR